MSSLTRRSFLKAASALAFLAAWPGSACSGLLDRILRPQQARGTPSITPNEEFYVTSYRSPPTIRIGEWALLVTGLVERPIILTYDRKLPRQGDSFMGEFLASRWARYRTGGRPANASWGRSSL